MILNVGSLCIDHVYGVPQLCAAGETIACTSYQIFPGGKGLNQSLAAARAGASVQHFGCIGADGALLTETLRLAGVDVDGVVEVAGASGHAVIQVDVHGDNAIVIHGGANRLLDLAQVEHSVCELTSADWLLLQNEVNDLQQILQIAGTAECKVALNVAPADAAARQLDLSSVDLLIVNEQEAAVLSGIENDERAIERLAQLNRHQSVVLTRGARGLLFATPQERGSLAAHRVQAIDGTAAGDAFVGYFVASIAAGESFQTALVRGSAAGALAATQPGAASSIPSRTDVDELVLEADI